MSLLSSCYSGMFTVFPVFRRKARDTTAPSLAPRLQRKMREGFPRNKWKLAARVTSVCKLAPTSWHLRAVRILALGDRLPVRVPKATTTRTNKWFANEKWQRNENFFFFFFCTKLVSFAVIWLALSDSFFFSHALKLVWGPIIDHFTVVCLVAWPLNESETGVDLVLIETSLLFLC